MAPHSPPGADGCQWPSWPDGEPAPYPPRFCDAARAVRPDGHRLPYCADHAAIAFVPRIRAAREGASNRPHGDLT